MWLLGSLCPLCGEERISGSATITLRATLSQSLTMAVTRDALRPGYDLLSDKTTPGNSPFTITAHWVRGPANVSMQAYSPANPLLGRAGQDMILVGTASPVGADPVSNFGDGFLPSARVQPSPGVSGLRIDTKDLEIPAGSDYGMLIIRAQVI